MWRKSPTTNNNAPKKQDSERNYAVLGYDTNDQLPDEFDLTELENDAVLNQELRDLGWSDDHEEVNHPPPLPPPNPVTRALSTNVPVNVVTTDSRAWEKQAVEEMDDLNDDDIQLTESDMNDPALLDMYHELETAGESPQKTVHHHEKTASIRNNDSTTIRKAETSNSNQNSIGINSTEGMNLSSIGPSSEEIKSRALQCYRVGKEEEATRWLRVSKLMAAGTSYEDATKSVVAATSAATATSTSTNAGKASSKEPPKQTSNNNVIVPSSSNKTSNQRLPNPTSSSIASSGTVSASSIHTNTPVASRETRFVLLESALREAQQQALNEAKRQKGTNDKLAIAKMREYKRYEQELAVLESRKGMIHAEPAPFLWRTVVTETAVEHVDIGEDQLCLFVEGLFDMEGALVGQSSRNITLTYDLGIPRDDPIVGQVQGKIDSNTWSCRMNFKRILPIIKRGKSIQQLLVRKKASFEVILNRGMFYSNVSLGITSLPLVDLLTKCECGGSLSLLKPAGESTGGRKGAMVSAGSVKMLLTLRKPLSQPEVIRTEERVLVLEQWPMVVNPQIKIDSSCHTASEMVTNDAPSSSAVAAAIATVQGSMPHALSPDEDHITTIATSTSPLTLTAREMTDPCAVEFLESNDVMEAELEVTQQALVALAGAPLFCHIHVLSLYFLT